MLRLEVVSEMAAARLRMDLAGTRVQVWRDVAGSVCASGYVGDAVSWMEWPRLATYAFANGSDTVKAIGEPDVAVARIQDVYFRSVLPLVLQATGREVLHASAVVTASGIMGFCGERGAGKSTVAFGLARRGLRQHSDDTLVLQIATRGIDSFALPFSCRLRPESAEFFRVAPEAPPASNSANMGSEAPVSALFILRPTERLASASVARLAPAAAFRAVLAHAHCFNPNHIESRRRLLQNYLDLSARVPVFEARFQRGLERLEPLLERLLDSAGVSAQAVSGVSAS